MKEKLAGKNHTFVSGMVVSDFQDGCAAYGKKHYVSDIEVRRLNGKKDRIPIVVPAGRVENVEGYKGQYVCASGQYHSRNYYDGQKRRLKLYLYVRDLSLKMDGDRKPDTNYIFLDGYLCRKPVYRMTPLGRTVTDLMLAVNRPYGRTDYIPCICWESTAYLAASLPAGFHVGIEGRVQSREYVKQTSGMEPETRIAYEVAVSKLEARNYTQK